MGDSFKKLLAISIIVLLTLAVISVAYYFVIALPKSNAARLKFEQDKYAEEKATRERKEDEERTEKAKKEGEAQFRQDMLDTCIARADEDAENYVLINGGETTNKGTVTAPRSVWDEAEKKKKTAKDECYRKWK